MNNPNRRTALKTVALAAGALFSIEAFALDAKPPKLRTRPIPGSWTFSGRACAIFQQGPILLLVNEVGKLATGRITGPDTFQIVSGEGWGRVTGQFVDRDKRIKWSDGAYWDQA